MCCKKIKIAFEAKQEVDKCNEVLLISYPSTRWQFFAYKTVDIRQWWSNCFDDKSAMKNCDDTPAMV